MQSYQNIPWMNKWKFWTPLVTSTARPRLTIKLLAVIRKRYGPLCINLRQVVLNTVAKILLEGFCSRGKHSFWFEWKKKGNTCQKVVFSFKGDICIPVPVYIFVNSCNFLFQHEHLHVTFQKLKSETLELHVVFIFLFSLNWPNPLENLTRNYHLSMFLWPLHTMISNVQMRPSTAIRRN